MLKVRKKREAQRSAIEAQRLGQVEASINSLVNEDLLDLADIFKQSSGTLIAQYAFAEMRRRGISL